MRERNYCVLAIRCAMIEPCHIHVHCCLTAWNVIGIICVRQNENLLRCESDSFGAMSAVASQAKCYYLNEWWR